MKNISRRDLIKTAGATTAMMAMASMDKASSVVHADDAKSDTPAMQLYKSLSDEQRQKICLPVDHKQRQYIKNWWYIHQEHRIPTTFNKDQQELIQATFDSLHNPEYQAAINDQVKVDQYGAAKNAPSIGFFGSPADKNFEFIYTGHHVTRRCNPHSAKGQGFGGAPIFYGHYPKDFTEKKDHPGNAYWYQAKIFNKFVQALDGKQQEKALAPGKPRAEKPDSIIAMHKTNRVGLSCAELSDDQQALLLKSMKRMLAMFRSGDVAATLDTIAKKKIDKLHVSYYGGKFDVGSDKYWDTWQIEGPEMVWYYRGQPHIHCYFHLKS
jgi:hypothetical protein